MTVSYLVPGGELRARTLVMGGDGALAAAPSRGATRARTSVSIVTAGLVAMALVGCGKERGLADSAGDASADAGTETDADAGSDAGDASGDGQNLDVSGGDGDGEADAESGMGTACEQAEQTKSNQGCTFWAVDLPNAWRVNLASPAPAEQTYAIVVANTATETAAVTVYAGNESTPLQMAMIPGNALHVFTFDDTYGTKARENSFGTAYRVESDYPVTAYQFNPLDNSTEVFSNDASLLFPAHVLDQDYTAVTSDGSRLMENGNLNMNFNAGAFVTVVADEDDTDVTIYPPDGMPVYPGSLAVNLSRGQTFTVLSDDVPGLFADMAGQGNMSGSRVEASKPVAVFSGNVAAFEPVPKAGCCADHVEHQMLPLSAWGRSYVVPLAPPNETNNASDSVRVRLTGSFDGTQLTYTPAAPAGAPAMLNAYETVVFTAPIDFGVSSDKPFSAVSFLQSNEAVTADPTPDDPADNLLFKGDPAMILLPATEQYQDDYVFLVPAAYELNYVTIIRPAGAQIRLDNTDLTAISSWQQIGSVGGTTWQRLHVPVEPGVHIVVSESGDDFAITVVGYSPAVSYGFAGGSGVEFIDFPPFPPVG